MSTNPTLFLNFSVKTNTWKVLDQENFCYGEGESVIEAVQSARKVTKKDIHFNNICYVHESDDYLITDIFELIDELANLAGMKVTRIFDNADQFVGYDMKLDEDNEFLKAEAAAEQYENDIVSAISSYMEDE